MGQIPTRRAEARTEAQTWIPALLLRLLVQEMVSLVDCGRSWASFRTSAFPS